MIYEVALDQTILPYRDHKDLFLSPGLVNPLAFRPEIRIHPWFPFEDLSFELNDLDAIISSEAELSSIFRQRMPRGAREKTYHKIDHPDKLDIMRVKDWLDYSCGIIWSDRGLLIINFYSDTVIVSMSDKLAHAVYGKTISQMFHESHTIYTTEAIQTDQVRHFMKAIKATWLPH